MLNERSIKKLDNLLSNAKIATTAKEVLREIADKKIQYLMARYILPIAKRNPMANEAMKALDSEKGGLSTLQYVSEFLKTLDKLNSTAATSATTPAGNGTGSDGSAATSVATTSAATSAPQKMATKDDLEALKGK